MHKRMLAEIIGVVTALLLLPLFGSKINTEVGPGPAQAQEDQDYRFLRQNYADSLIQNAAAPNWAAYQLWLRDLVRQFLYATMKWQREDGGIYQGLNDMRIDDETELFQNWMPYYLLTGDEKVFTAIKKAVFLYIQYSQARFDHGYFKDDYFDTEHTLEALIILANLAYAKPNDAEVISALRDVVEHCGNFVPGYTPWFNTTTKHLRSVGPGTKEISTSCPRGVDWPFNMQFIKMALAYYNATKDARYLNWSRDYLDGWIESIQRNQRENGVPLIPWEVEPITGALGPCSGKWWDDAWAWNWGWATGSFESIRDSRGAFLDYYRITKQRPYLETMKRMVNFCFEQSTNPAPAVWLKDGHWWNDNRSWCAGPIAIAASLLDTQADPTYENRILGWYNYGGSQIYEQLFWRFRRYGDYEAIQGVLNRTVRSVAGNVAEFEGMTAIPPDPDNFPDVEGMEGLTMTAFGGLANDRGEMPWTEVMYFRDNNSLGLEEGVAGLVERSDDTVRVVSLFNTNTTTKYVKLQADFIPKTIQKMRLNLDPPVPVQSLLARVTLPPEQLIRVTLWVGSRDTIPPLSATNLRMLNSTENSIRIAWDAPGMAADGETAVGYVVKRDGRELARRDSLQFTDTGLSEGFSYTYDVVSMDVSGNLSRTFVSATFNSKADLTPPLLKTVTMVDSMRLSLLFSEPVTLASVSNLAYYTILPQVNVQQALLLADKKSVTLQTAAHRDGINYSLTVVNVKDSSRAQNTMPAASFTYSFTMPIKVTNVSPATYLVRKTVVDDSVYKDRSYRLQTIPTLFLNQSRIVTANNDKGMTGDAFLTFTVNQHVNVYVAYDRDLITIPAWLQSWRKTDLVVQTNDSPFLCYQKYFAPGTVTLGGNAGVGSNSMYLVFLEPATDNAPPAAPTGLVVLPLGSR